MFSSFYQKFGKRGVDILLSIFGVIFLFPVFLVCAILVKLDSAGPIFFKQKRIGKNGKVFTLYKFRTMVGNAEILKKKYLHSNEADGPVFKIKDDPRFTKIGKKLSHTGLDELPQFFNILKGEMSLVGPRPFPVDEEAKISKEIRLFRRKVRPGLVCSWLVSGAHKLSFKEWMNFDLVDIKKSSFTHDIDVISKTILLGLKLIKDEILKKNHFPFQ